MKRLRAGLLFALVLFALSFPWCFPNPAVTSIAIFTWLYATSAISWNTFSGYTGYISLGQATFFGVGAYTIAILCQDWHLPAGPLPLLLLPLAGLTASMCAAVSGWMALRVRGDAFVIITIAFFFSFQLLAYNLGGITNGSVGINLPIPSWNGEDFNLPFYYVSLALVLLALGCSWGVRSSKFGLGLLAIRDDEDRARGLGIRTGRYKWVAYLLSALFTGLAGGIYAYFVGSVYPAFAFDPTFDVAITLMSFLGGMGTLWGPVVGAMLVEPLQQYLTLQFGASGLDQILYGSIFLLTLFVLPKGILPSVHQHWHRISSKGQDPSALLPEACSDTGGEKPQRAGIPVPQETVNSTLHTKRRGKPWPCSPMTILASLRQSGIREKKRAYRSYERGNEDVVQPTQD